MCFRILIACGVYHEDLQLRAKLMKDLPACAAWCGCSWCANSEGPKLSLTFRDSRCQRNSLGT